MKTRLSLLATAVACTLAFAACDVEDLIKETINDIVNEISGNMSVTASSAENGAQPFANGDTVKTSIAVCDIDSTTSQLRIAGIQGSLHNNTLGDSNFPVLFVSITDTLAVRHAIDFPLNNIDFVINSNWNDLVFNNSSNLFILATDKDNYYVSTSGIIALDSLGRTGEQASGSLNNITCKYISADRVDYLRYLADQAADTSLDINVRRNYADSLSSIDASSYFPSITFNGTFSATRANISKYLRAIEALED